MLTAMTTPLAVEMQKEVATLIERVEGEIADPAVQESGLVVRVGTAAAYHDSPVGVMGFHGAASVGSSSTSIG
jgi:hypothetical protein